MAPAPEKPGGLWSKNLCSPDLMLSDNHLGSLLVLDNVQEKAILRDRQRAHDLADTCCGCHDPHQLTDRKDKWHAALRPKLANNVTGEMTA
jgi:hypothetical protein